MAGGMASVDLSFREVLLSSFCSFLSRSMWALSSLSIFLKGALLTTSYVPRRLESISSFHYMTCGPSQQNSFLYQLSYQHEFYLASDC